MTQRRKIGSCAKCGGGVLSVRDRKDHTIGEPSRIGLVGYRAGVKL
jgi:hypothetical protein